MSKRKISPKSLFLIVAVALAFSTVQIQGAAAAHKPALDAALATYSAALAKADATYNAALATAAATLAAALALATAALDAADAIAKATAALDAADATYAKARVDYTAVRNDNAELCRAGNAGNVIAARACFNIITTAMFVLSVVENARDALRWPLAHAEAAAKAAGGFDAAAAAAAKAAYNAAAATAATAIAKAYAAALATADAAIAAYGAAIDAKFATRTPPVLKPKPVSLKSVSNGCGGGEPHTNPQFLDTATFSPVFGDKLTVNFRLACNVHDAGYSGVLVRNPLHLNKEVDFSRWSREELDKLFLFNLKKMCREQLQGSPLLRTKCYARVHTYYAFVRLVGEKYFNANPITPGTDTHRWRSKF